MKKLMIAIVLAGVVQGSLALGIGRAGLFQAQAGLNATMVKVDAAQ